MSTERLFHYWVGGSCVDGMWSNVGACGQREGVNNLIFILDIINRWHLAKHPKLTDSTSSKLSLHGLGLLWGNINIVNIRSYREYEILRIFSGMLCSVSWYRQWRTEHKCARGDDLKWRPFRNKNFLRRKKFQPTWKNFWRPILVIHQKSENYTCNELCRSLSLLACAAPNFHLFCPFLLKISPFFT